MLNRLEGMFTREVANSKVNIIPLGTWLLGKTVNTSDCHSEDSEFNSRRSRQF